MWRYREWLSALKLHTWATLVIHFLFCHFFSLSFFYFFEMNIFRRNKLFSLYFHFYFTSSLIPSLLYPKRETSLARCINFIGFFCIKKIEIFSDFWFSLAIFSAPHLKLLHEKSLSSASHDARFRLIVGKIEREIHFALLMDFHFQLLDFAKKKRCERNAALGVLRNVGEEESFVFDCVKIFLLWLHQKSIARFPPSHEHWFSEQNFSVGLRREINCDCQKKINRKSRHTWSQHTFWVAHSV